MAITNAQQAKQIMMKKGGTLTSKKGKEPSKDGKRPEVQAPRCKWQSAIG